jgi:hypothetical protein
VVEGFCSHVFGVAKDLVSDLVAGGSISGGLSFWMVYFRSSWK